MDSRIHKNSLVTLFSSLFFASSFQTLAFSLAMFLTLPGCGYRLAGTGGQTPGDIKSISIEMLRNRTAEVGIETIFTNAILDQFIRWKRLAVKPHSQAEAVLAGSIIRIQTATASHISVKRTLETRVTVTLDLTLKRVETGEVLWRNPSLSYHETFLETNVALATDRLRRQAIREIADFLAERIHNDILVGF